MKKALIYALALALALSLTACSQPKTEQPTDPAPSTSAPETIATPEPIKDTTPASEPNEIKELSGTELLEYFQKVYDIHQEIHIATTLDGLINEELEFLEGLAESDGYTLPSDYEAQYMDWRPATDFPADTQGQQVSNPQQVSDQQSKPSTDTQQNGSQQTQKPSQPQSQQPSGDSYDPYDGFGSYEAMINEYCKRYPELSREEIMNRNPDPTTVYVDEAAARAADAADRLKSGSQTQQTQQPQQTSSSQKIDGHDDLGDYVLNGKGGKYYPALNITLPVSYDGKTTNGSSYVDPEWEAAGDHISADGHRENWEGVSMGG